MTKFEQLQEIAKQHLNIPTLETRNSDSDDFHEVAVWTLLTALGLAYEAGREHGQEEAEAIAEADALAEYHLNQLNG